MSSKDVFSAAAGEYRRYRPGYPEALFRGLGVLAPNRSMALDCGAGNGQAASGLAREFHLVLAVDLSAGQLEHAVAAGNVCYIAARAEQLPVPTGSVAMVSVALALHWFDQSAFFAEVARVLARNGIFAAWSYGDTQIDPRVDAVTAMIKNDLLGPYWPTETEHADVSRECLPAEFEMVTMPDFCLRATWRFSDLVGYIGSWSAAQAYQRVNGVSPLNAVREALREVWDDAHMLRDVQWPLAVIVGRKRG